MKQVELGDSGANFLHPTYFEPAGRACLSSLEMLRNKGRGASSPSPAILKYSARLKFSVDPQMCNEFYCNSASTAFIVFNCHEIGLVAVVLRHHNLLSPASPPFISFSESFSTILHFSFLIIILLSGSSRLLLF